MATQEKTVFFGPFFGELGWELAYWHGWVKKMCRERYQSFRKIIASYPGREPFYPDLDEFWPHPSEIYKLKISQRNYTSDFWIGNLPKGNIYANFDRNIGKYARDLLQKYKEKLPADTVFYVPHSLNAYQSEGDWKFFGSLILKGVGFFKTIKVLSIDFEHQIFEAIKPTSQGREFLRKIVNSDQRIIAIFPRSRLKRPDVNWPIEKYSLLINNLQKKYPRHLIGIFGSPGGAYFADGAPSNCLDLINLPENLRFNVQLAALEQTDLAVGGMSGAIHVVLMSGCPSLTWGYEVKKGTVNKQNFLKTRMVYWPEVNPSVKKIEDLVDLMMNKKEKEIIYPADLKENWNYKEKRSSIAKTTDFIRLAFREIASRLLLQYLKNKKLEEGVVNNIFLKK